MMMYSCHNTNMRKKKRGFIRLIGNRSLRASLSVSIIVLSFFYVMQTNAASTKGYLMSDLENQIKTLEQENRRLEVEIAKNQSMQSIQERLAQVDLVAIDHADYLNVVGTAVAQR